MVPDLFLFWDLNILILGLFRISSLPVPGRPGIRILTVLLLCLQGNVQLPKPRTEFMRYRTSTPGERSYRLMPLPGRCEEHRGNPGRKQS
jgi:hypothetical protein